ncbi:hypothetical protein K492DRAFT_172122 [Lichtheimia hyalospora FSU 10163]|nr:hypothetical protein K492DRAFT_172122 [Lichtheimia hyalospora FSU 10163]
MLKSALALLLTLAVTTPTTLACEPECRHGVAAAFAEQYVPVVQVAVNDLSNTFASTLFNANATLPNHVAAVVPEQTLRSSLTTSLSDTLSLFVDEATGKKLESGIFSVMFSEEDPFKGDCNAPPRRLTRNMPPAGESWTREECEKMDYICGNPPSICHFLPQVKERIVKRIRSQLEDYATFDNGFLVRNVVQTVKQTTHGVLSHYGAGSMVNDPSVTTYVNALVSNAIQSLDVWATVHVKQLCDRTEHDQACNSWDEQIIPEILKWP